jgi:PAS domain S-box-containing protein
VADVRTGRQKTRGIALIKRVGPLKVGSQGFIGKVQFSLQMQPEPEARGGSKKPPSHVRAETGYFGPFQRIPIPVHSMGPDGLLLEVNDAWVVYTGYSRAQAIGRSFAEFLDLPSALNYRQRAVPELIDTVPARESRSVEYRLIRCTGDAADIVLTARPERDPVTGRFLHSLSVLNDVTARNRAESALRQAQKLEALGALTSGVAHDFNNLLMIIQGSLQLLSKRLPAEDERAGRLLDAALQGAARGAALTTRLLAFARQQELAPLPLDPRKLLASLRPMLVQMLGPSILIEEVLPADLWNLRADPNQLELALLNLAANARDAMPAGGRLRLAARNATVVPIETAFIGLRSRPAAPVGAHVVLTVSDNGIGMDEAALALRLNPSSPPRGPGRVLASAYQWFMALRCNPAEDYCSRAGLAQAQM